jgi:hypothetical protein
MKINNNQFTSLENKMINIENLISILIKRVSNDSTPPKAWLTSDKQGEATELRNQNPETYDYICEVLKLYFC